MLMDKNEDQSYELKIRILGNEVIAVSLSTTSTSDRWIIVTFVTIFSMLVILGAYGDKFAQYYQSVVG